MLTEERYKIILEFLKENGTASVNQLVGELNTSESTVRRDLSALDSMNKLTKVHGGATVLNSEYFFEEQSIKAKKKLFIKEKAEIAKYAAGTLHKGDFIFMDAGTTTEKMIDFITETDISVVTNSFTHAKKLAQRGIRVTIVGGQIKSSTEAIVGSESVLAIEKFNFTKCYLGTNGISFSGGFSTPDIDEANVKNAAFRKSYITYILADHSKFDKVSSVIFAPLTDACIITDKVVNSKYYDKCFIKEVIK